MLRSSPNAVPYSAGSFDVLADRARIQREKNEAIGSSWRMAAPFGLQSDVVRLSVS